MAHRTKLLLATAAVVALVLVAMMVWGGLIIASRMVIPEQVTDLSRYAEMRSAWNPPEMVSHFPGDVPASADDAQLAAFPGFLQGSAYLQLRLKLPGFEVVDLQARFHAKAIRTLQGGVSRFHYVNRDRDTGVPLPIFVTNPKADETQWDWEFPDSYVLHVLGAEDFSEGTWNHGRIWGIAICDESNNVVFYAEQW